MFVNKALRLISLLPARPIEFYDRVTAIVEVRREQGCSRPNVYDPKAWDEVISSVEQVLEKDIEVFLNESALAEIEAEVRQGIENISSEGPFGLFHNGDLILARLCYMLCRTLKPSILLETGVAYGVTSAFILKALEVNGEGMLHSIDLPPLGNQADRFVGNLIPQSLKHRWLLHRGTSKRVMPKLLSHLGQIDIFIHDSLHTYGNISRELKMISPQLKSRSVVICDDLEGNVAFHEWGIQKKPDFWATIQEANKSNSLCGIAVFVDRHPSAS